MESFLREVSSSTIYFYRKFKKESNENSRCACLSQPIKNCLTSRSDAEYEDFKPSINIESSDNYSQSITHGLFVHFCPIIRSGITDDSTKNLKMKKIVFLSNNKAHPRWEHLCKIVNDYKEKTSSKNLVIFKNTQEIRERETLEAENYSLVCVIERPANPYVGHSGRSHEIAIRSYIKSIVFDREYIFNLENFLNYCNPKKALKLEKCELETSVLTLIELLQERYNNALKKQCKDKELHLTYYDLLIPDSTDSAWDYNDCLLIFVNTLAEYILTTWFPDITRDESKDEIKNIFEEYMPVLLSCLQETLGDSIRIDQINHTKTTAILICKRVSTYVCSYTCSPVSSCLTVINKNDSYSQRKLKDICKKFNLVFCLLMLTFLFSR